MNLLELILMQKIIFLLKLLKYTITLTKVSTEKLTKKSLIDNFSRRFLELEFKNIVQ